MPTRAQERSPEASLPLVSMVVSSYHYIDMALQMAREGEKTARADWELMQEFGVPVAQKPILGASDAFITAVLGHLKATPFGSRHSRRPGTSSFLGWCWGRLRHDMDRRKDLRSGEELTWRSHTTRD